MRWFELCALKLAVEMRGMELCGYDWRPVFLPTHIFRLETLKKYMKNLSYLSDALCKI